MGCPESPLIYLYYRNNDSVEADSAFCQPDETLLTEALAKVNSSFRGLAKMHCQPQEALYLFHYTEQNCYKIMLIYFTNLQDNKIQSMQCFCFL